MILFLFGYNYSLFEMERNKTVLCFLCYLLVGLCWQGGISLPRDRLSSTFSFSPILLPPTTTDAGVPVEHALLLLDEEQLTRSPLGKQTLIHMPSGKPPISQLVFSVLYHLFCRHRTENCKGRQEGWARIQLHMSDAESVL